MATKIRRSLFIGLGGTGMRTLLYLKKLFVDTYGEVPPMIGFLGVDTDKGEFSKELETKASGNVGVMSESGVETTLFVKGNHRISEIVKLEPIEQMQITVEHPKDIFEVRKEHFKWIPKSNVNSLKSLTHGAGQVRTNGRFALIANNQEVENKVHEALSRVANVQFVDNPDYELIDEATDIYLIFSLGGGTGCGTFIDMAYLIRRAAKDCKLAAYVLLPKIFKTKYNNGMDRVMPNGYGAMMDLDWLMCHDWNDAPIMLPLQDGLKTETKDSPFDACIFIDNENRTQDKYLDNKQLEEMIALSLITSVGELSVANTSVLDNLAVNATGGSFDVEKKRAWASGMGVCEVLVQSDEIRKIYAHNVAKHIINSLLQRVDMSQAVLNWIQSPDVKICEHEADDVIDYLLPKEPTPMPAIDKDDYDDALGVCNNYIAGQTDCPEVEGRLGGLKERISGQLRSFLIETLNRKQGGGVGAAIDMLQSLNGYIQIYLKEMEDEKSNFDSELVNYETALQTKTTELGNAGFFDNKAAIAREVQEASTNLARLKREIIRRSNAITFFNDLMIRIQKHLDDVNLLETRLKNSSTSSNEEIAKIRMNLSRNTETFQYDVTSYVMSTSVVDENNIMISDFIDSLGGNKVYDLLESETANIWKSLLDYAYFSKHAEEIGALTINGILENLPQKEFDDLVRKIVVKASPLLPHDFHGYKTGKPAINYYIGVNDFGTNRLFKDDYFKKNIRDAADVNFSRIGMKDRLIVFSQMNPIPPFAIASIAQCRNEYDDPRQTICFHFDDLIYSEMKRTGYSIFPVDTKGDVLELWIKGFVFGRIKNEGGRYLILSESEGKKLRHYWVELAPDRDDAFKEFDEKSTIYGKELKDFLDEFISSKGAGAYSEKISDAQSGDKYLDEISQVGLTIDELEQKQNKAIFDLLEAELECLEKM